MNTFANNVIKNTNTGNLVAQGTHLHERVCGLIEAADFHRAELHGYEVDCYGRVIVPELRPGAGQSFEIRVPRGTAWDIF